MELETVINNLRDGYNKLEQGSLRTARQLQDERRTNPDEKERKKLRDEWHYAADGHGYFLLGDGDVEWAITPEDSNLVLRHLNDNVNSSYQQLVDTHNFRPENVEAVAAKAAAGTLVTRMSRLRLSGTDQESKEWRYLAVRASDGFVKVGGEYVVPTDDEKRVMDRLGHTLENLRMLHGSPQKIEETRGYVLNPAYVCDEARKDPAHHSLWRASRLYSFDGSSGFSADVRNVSDRSALRGVRRASVASRAPEGRAPENEEVPRAPQEVTVERCYEVLVADPSRAAASLNDQTAAGLSRILTTYLSSRAQQSS